MRSKPAAIAALADASASDDRIALSIDGVRLSGTNGGGGASVGWLHNFDPDALGSVAVEHQDLSVAHWTFGSLIGAVTRGPDAEQRYTFSGEVHEGAGDDGPRAFKYSVEALAVSGTYRHRWSVQLEDKQIDVDTTHGNLPKLGLTCLWNPHFQTALSYSHSVSGNLGTRLTAARIDVFGSALNFLVGGAWGQAAPTVLGFGFVLPPGTLNEAYVGVSKPLPSLRSELTLVVDYIDLPGRSTIPLSSGASSVVVPSSRRVTGTLSYVVHVGAGGKAR